MRRLASVFVMSALVACSDGSGPSSQPASGEWLKGDFHLHSSHSNDAQDNPVGPVIARAEALGMDYFVFTDHDNHVQGNITHFIAMTNPIYVSFP